MRNNVTVLNTSMALIDWLLRNACSRDAGLQNALHTHFNPETVKLHATLRYAYDYEI